MIKHLRKIRHRTTLTYHNSLCDKFHWYHHWHQHPHHRHFHWALLIIFIIKIALVIGPYFYYQPVSAKKPGQPGPPSQPGQQGQSQGQGGPPSQLGGRAPAGGAYGSARGGSARGGDGARGGASGGGGGASRGGGGGAVILPQFLLRSQAPPIKEVIEEPARPAERDKLGEAGPPRLAVFGEAGETEIEELPTLQPQPEVDEPQVQTVDATTTTYTPPILFAHNLGYGNVGPDVKALQQFLNKEGFILAETGIGSPGNETNEFGPLTNAALILFQEANAEGILIPLGLTEGTGFLGSSTMTFINTALESEGVGEAVQEIPDEPVVEPVDEPIKKQAQKKIFDKEATHSCEIVPFSKKLSRGQSERRIIKLKPGKESQPFKLELGALPDGIRLISDTTSGQGEIDVGFNLEATEDAKQGSFNIIVVYQVTETDGQVLNNFCQLNVIVE